ncbi:triosephosphate isomerase [Weissella uvarum]|uniref:triose-phosphate isomerase n=1 Tax=Weissella uvarum TaxID=1479233 RepID=UPI001960A8A1|nr:triose-phosphate isomerase [Weissella uvarum]MBM7618000.1 triosephosphate isomerase [Weissella uvarum]MCM0596219.1 triose-phosphate isomerase [Weissella uvarum]
MERRPIVMANWKMNKQPNEAIAYIQTAAKAVASYPDVEPILAGQDVLLQSMVDAAEDTTIEIGAENVYWKEEGAYTGETSPKVVANLGVQYVIIGHSERRNYFRETDEMVNLKALAALRNGLKPIIALDETVQTESNNAHMHWIVNQVIEALKGVSKDQMQSVVLAYEPTQAIGSGMAMGPEQAQKDLYMIRETVSDMFDAKVAEQLRILYGGSVKPENAYAIMRQRDIDGVLVGNSALDPDNFIELVKLAHQAKKTK